MARHLRRNVKNLDAGHGDVFNAPPNAVDAVPMPLRALVAGVALLLAGLAQHQITTGQQTVMELVLLLGASIAFGLAIPSEGVQLAPLSSVTDPRSENHLRADRMAIVPSLCILAASLFLFWQDRQRGTAFIIWFTAMIWYVTSYLPGIGQVRSKGRNAAFSISGWAAVFGMVILVLVGIVNFWDLGAIPYGLWWDEANFGLYAQQILHHAIDFPLLAPFGDPSLEFYLHAVEQQVFGATEFSTRVLVAVCGIVGVALAGVIVAMLWNRWVALVAMVVLGFMRWHIDFSRFGIHEMSFQAFELAVVVTLIAGIKQRKPVWFALCGVLLGLSIHIYSPAFALTVLVVLTLAYGLLFLRPRLSLSLTVLVLVGFVLAYAPLLEAGIQNPELFNARAKQVSVFGPNNQYPPLQALEHNIRAHVLMFNVDGDHNGRHNIPGKPQLDNISAVLFVLGAAWVAIRARRPQYAFLIFWFLAMMAPGVLSLDFEAPQSGRAAGAQPVVAIVITLALCGAVTLLGRAVAVVMPRARSVRALPVAVVLAVLTYLSVSNVQAYFDAEVHNESVWEVWASDATFVGQGLASLPPSELTYLSPELSGHPDIAYLAPGHASGAPLNPAHDLPFVENGPIAVFLSRSDYYYVSLLKAYYPKADIRVLQGPERTTPPLAYGVLLSKSVVNRVHGLSFQYEGVGSRSHANVSGLTFPHPAPTAPGTAIWTGGVRIGSYGRAILAVTAPGYIRVDLDGHRVCVGHNTVKCTRNWVRGNHALRVQVDLGSASRPRISWRWSGSSGFAFFDSSRMGSGLSVSYYPNAHWRGAPTIVQKEPQVDYYYQILPLPRPFSVAWRGSIYAPATGQYSFALDSVDDSSISIDGTTLLHVQANLANARTTTLARGWHRVVVRLRALNSFTHIFLTWERPGKTTFTPVPSDDFRP